MFQTHKQIIDAWPDLGAFAVDAGTSYNTAKQMRRRDSISDEYWVAVVTGAERRAIDGVTLEALATIAAARAGRLPVPSPAEKRAAA